jgi:two-component system sensor histidine kinase PilS (NtrC family)
MEIAISEMNRLNSIITDFLQYARPRGPKKRLFDVSAILKEVIALVQSSLNGKDVKLLADLKEGEIISADPDLLRQVFWNLCKNAVEAIEDKGVVEIKAEKRDGTFEVIFKDNGQGLSKDEIEKIFLPFYTTKETGTGLGLAIAEKIIEEHGGKILVWSDGKGKGATFKVVIPIREEKV